MKIVYIAHPVGGDVEGNIKKILEVVKEVRGIYGESVFPFVPYLSSIMALDDSVIEDRKVAFLWNQHLFKNKSFDEIWLYGDRISAGMTIEIEWARKYGIPVKARTQETKNQL